MIWVSIREISEISWNFPTRSWNRVRNRLEKATECGKELPTVL